MSGRPQRLYIFGVTGSGKTTLARRLAQQLRLPVLQLDAIRHRGGWDATPFAQMRDEVTAWLDDASEGWICEGNYRRVRDLPLSRVDTVVWLRLPWRVSFARLFLRTLARARTGDAIYGPDGPRESWQRAFASRESILWWAIHHHRKTTRSIAAALAQLRPGVRVHVLRSPAEVDQFVAALAGPNAAT